MVRLPYYTFFSDYEKAPFIKHSTKNLTSTSTSEVIISYRHFHKHQICSFSALFGVKLAYFCNFTNFHQ